MKLKVLFDKEQTMFLDGVVKFEIKADEPMTDYAAEMPEFMKKKIAENKDQPEEESRRLIDLTKLKKASIIIDVG